jgi:hypothetical protein
VYTGVLAFVVNGRDLVVVVVSSRTKYQVWLENEARLEMESVNGLLWRLQQVPSVSRPDCTTAVRGTVVALQHTKANQNQRPESQLLDSQREQPAVLSRPRAGLGTMTV